jgi:hypothetical protein
MIKLQNIKKAIQLKKEGHLSFLKKDNYLKYDIAIV